MTSCPVALVHKTQIVSEVFQVHRWAKVLGQPIKDKYPNGIPDIIIRGVDALDCGLALAERERFEKLKRQNGNS